MLKLDWRKFEIINEKYENAFQTLCLHLFCRSLHADNISADFNQAGIETEPVTYKGKVYGFQSKYFDKTMDYKQIKKSVEKALELYPELDVIKIYYNCNARLSTSSTKIQLDKEAQKCGVKLEWLGKEFFEIELNKKNNYDLCQLFFGLGRELEYISDTIPVAKREFFNSNRYLELDICNNQQNFHTAKELVDDILTDGNIAIIKGLPGTGKSVLLEKIFTTISGADCDFYEQIKRIAQWGCVPFLIKLKYCAYASIEQLIREKKQEYKMNSDNYKIIYLFDGLDEVPAEEAEKIVAYVHELATNNNTRKIVFTIRKASQNNVYLQEIKACSTVYEVKSLDNKAVTNYFRNRGEREKIDALGTIKQNNMLLLNEIKDVLLLNLLYDTVEKVNDTTTLYDLFAMKEQRLDNVRKGKVEILDLPEPKDKSILELNKKIAYMMHCNKEVIISQKDFMNIIYSEFPKVSYKSANEIASYILETYFENNLEDKVYSYQHRRYQEYFYVLYLYQLYKETPVNLRKEEVFTNCEFFDDFFLPYLEKVGDKEKNLIQQIEVNLFKNYLGKNVMWGADNPWYQYSEEFCYALASQPEKRFYQILEDSSMSLRGNVIADYESIIKTVKYVAALRIGYIPDPVEEIFRFALKSIVIHWKCGKNDYAKVLLEDMKRAITFIKAEYPKMVQKVEKAFYEEKNAITFISLLMGGKTLQEKLDNINKYEIKEKSVGRKTAYEEAVEAYFDIALNYFQTEFLEVMECFDDENIESFCKFIIQAKHVHYLCNENIREKLCLLLEKCSKESLGVIMMKVYMSMEVTEQAKEVIKREYDKLSNERWIDLFGFDKAYDTAAFLSMIMGKNCVAEKYAHDSRVMYQNVYCHYIKVLEGTMTYSKMISLFFINQNNVDINKYENITYYISILFGAIIENLDMEFAETQNLVEKIISQPHNVIHLGLLFTTLKKDGFKHIDKLFRRFVSDIIKSYEKFESMDISENIEKNFRIAYIHSHLDVDKSLDYIRKGLNYGIIRHGWRKDGIVDTYLLQALEIMWEKNYFEWNELKKFTEELFDMILVLNRITDEAYRCSSIENLIKILIKNDFTLAQQIMFKVAENDLYTNSIIFLYVEQMINMGMDLEEINSWMEKFDFRNYNEESVTMKVELLLVAYYCGWYSEEEKQKLKKMIIKYLDGGWGVSSIYWSEKYYCFYLQFCKEEQRDVSINCEINNDTETDDDKEEAFCKKIATCRTKKTLQKYFSQLIDYRNHITIRNGENWNMIVDKIYEIDGNLDKLIDYLEQCKFPHETFYTANSGYLYMPVGQYIKKFGVTEQLWNCIKKNGGYADFINFIKAYDYVGNKEMCASLFARFFSFCRLLVFDEIK